MISLNPWVVFTILYRDYSIFHTSYIQIFVLTTHHHLCSINKPQSWHFLCLYLPHLFPQQTVSFYHPVWEIWKGGNFSSFSLIKSWLSIFKKCKKDFNMRSSIQDFLEGAASITSNKPQWSKVPKINFYVQNIHNL